MEKKVYFTLPPRCCVSFLFLFCLSLSMFQSFTPSALFAQRTFTQNLTRLVAGEGKVTLHQDAEIEALVNGISQNVSATATTGNARPATPATKPIAKVQSDSIAASDTAIVSPITTGRRMKVNGYRIQVYAGGNNRQSKLEAYRMASLVRSNFEDVSVYTHFISPRWICRVGDFRTYEEANELLRRMRQTQKFREASIVKSKIIVFY